MRRLAVTLVVVVIITGACGDSAAPRPYIEPVPFDPAVDLPSSTTTTEAAPATTTFDAAALFDDLLDQHGLADIPAAAWADFAYAGCQDGIWDRGVNFAFAEDFMRIDFADVEPNLDDPVLVAQLLWLKSVERCGDEFPTGAVDRGPPTVYEYPRCRSGLQVWALPWSDDVGEPDSGQDHGVGIAYEFWHAGDRTFAIVQGADPTFEDDYNSGTSAGTINGNDARIVEVDDAVGVVWRQGPGHCDAYRMFFQPQPETDDLVAYAQSLLEPPPNLFANEAEIRMAAAVPLIEGYADGGGEPSHGGPDAVYLFADDAGWFEVHAIGVEVANLNPPEVDNVLEVDGTVFELFYDDQGSNIITRGVSFIADDYRVTVRTTPDDERLMAFALEFRRAWLAGAPAEG